VGAVQLIVNDLSAALLAPMVGADGAAAVQVMTQSGVNSVTPFTEFVILQLNVVVPRVLIPVSVVDAEDGEVIVQFTPVTDHTYDNVPSFVLLADAVTAVVVALRAADIALVEIPVRNDDMTTPKNPDIYFIIYKILILPYYKILCKC
jgi:hypothetical protein